ncbi:MAG: M48 family metalloprotease, partial [Rhodobacteraceae bacterium]|nr:M48 family metalloprotease [Paracoccaceae bacterium]
NQGVGGSNPSGRAIKDHKIKRLRITIAAFFLPLFPLVPINLTRERLSAYSARCCTDKWGISPDHFIVAPQNSSAPKINSFCLPGGKVGVYSGMLPITSDETGLATVIGHEVAHAVARHGAERISEGLINESEPIG